MIYGGASRYNWILPPGNAMDLEGLPSLSRAESSHNRDGELFDIWHHATEIDGVTGLFSGHQGRRFVHDMVNWPSWLLGPSQADAFAPQIRSKKPATGVAEGMSHVVQGCSVHFLDGEVYYLMAAWLHGQPLEKSEEPEANSKSQAHLKRFTFASWRWIKLMQRTGVLHVWVLPALDSLGSWSCWNVGHGKGWGTPKPNQMI